MDSREYEVIIIGGGPAGLTAGLYTARARLSSLLLEREMIGGQIANIERLENFPGFPEGIDGFDLSQSMHQQALKYGLKIITAEAVGLELKNGQKIVKTNEGNFLSHVVIIAGASRRQKLDVPGEQEYTGKGVSYCATCDAPMFKDRAVAVVGGGNAAITEALHLAKFASQVTVIHRRRELRATRIIQERAFAEPKIKFMWNTVVEKIEGKDFLEKLRLAEVPDGRKLTLEVAGVFVAIGFRPDTGYLKGIVPLDKIGHIITNEKMETGVPGIYAAGDIRHSSVRQAITAAGDGATAAVYAERFLAEQHGK